MSVLIPTVFRGRRGFGELALAAAITTAPIRHGPNQWAGSGPARRRTPVAEF